MNDRTIIAPQQPQAGFVPAGTRLSGIYEIDAPLAKGGMGEVYRGHGIETNDPVAIKLIRSDMADNEAALALFRREASALNRLHHEAIVRYFVFTLDPVLQRHYLAMELVEGQSLSDVLTRGPLSVEDTHKLLKRIASGLQAAHERGVVHRDMSPDNIIIEGGDVAQARIIDFGIARSTRVGDSTVIGSGFAGKYNYVSPEQLGLYGGVVDGKSDIYSLGLVLAQCLRGKPIDMGGSQADIIDKRRRSPDLADIDARIRPLLERMLQPDPADRPASMGEAGAWTLDAPTTRGARRGAAAPRNARAPSDAKAASSRRPVFVAAGVAGLCLAGALTYWLMLDDAPKFAVPAPVPRLDQQQAGLQSGGDGAKDEAPPTIAPALTATPPLLAPSDPVVRAVRYLKDYDGGGCFLALPTLVSAQSAEIDAFAIDDIPFNVLDEAFKTAMGWEAAIDGGQVAQAQCNALQSLRKIWANPGSAAGKLQIAATRVKAGETLEGKFTTAAKNAALLIIDESGMVHDVTAQLAGAGNERTFAMRLSRSNTSRSQPMLLAAIGSEQPLAATAGAASGPSDEALLALQRAAAQGGPLDIAVKYFKLD